VLVHPEEDGIVYLNLYFNMAGITREHLPSAGFWSTLPTNLRTKSHTLAQLQENIKRDLGDFSIYLDAYSEKNEPDSCYPIIGVSVSALKQNIHKAIPILKEILQETVYEKDTILPLLKQDNESFRQELINSGHTDAMRRAAAHESAEGVFREFVGGYESGRCTKRNWKTTMIRTDPMNSCRNVKCMRMFCSQRPELQYLLQEKRIPMSGKEVILDNLHDYDANRAKVHYPLMQAEMNPLIIQLELPMLQ
jgi:Zn-dependent M16 (insulinase) family peptidase